MWSIYYIHLIMSYLVVDLGSKCDEVFANVLIEKVRDLKTHEVPPGQQILKEIQDDDDLEEGDGPSPSFPITPLNSEVNSTLTSQIEDEDEEVSLPQVEFISKVWIASWNCCHYHALPIWLQDNDFLIQSHRPPLPSVLECFKSIFRLHTETGNIWTHLLGCLSFISLAVWFLTRPSWEIQLEQKLVFAVFFVGAISCLGISFVFHTLICHSEYVAKFFSKMDYVGIALLIMGSLFSWLYYGFYCETIPRIIYFTATFVLGFASIVVSLWDKFGETKFRPLRAGLFVGFGLSGVIPSLHCAIAKGWNHAISKASLGWVILMGSLYIFGAVIYAVRIPERWFPGKCDIWFHSHQFFHVLVIAAAYIHYHGISIMAMHRGDCKVHPYETINL